MNTPTNTDDVIDSRDVIARIEELTDSIETVLDKDIADADDLEGLPNDTASDLEELETLQALAEEASASPDWPYGETLIRDSYFEEYAQELAEDCGMVADGAKWPHRCIDWEQAARELQMDYMCVDFDGVDYWIPA